VTGGYPRVVKTRVGVGEGQENTLQMPFWTLKRGMEARRVLGRSPVSDFFRTRTRKGPKSAILDTFGQFWRVFEDFSMVRSDPVGKVALV